MHRFVLRSVLGSAVAATPLALALVLSMPPASGGDRRAQRADPFSERNLARTVASVVPEVEKAAGRRFVTPPVVELVDPTVLREMVRQEEELISAAVLRDTSPERRAELADEHSQLVDASGLLGKYGLFEKKLFLAQDAIRGAVDTAEVVDEDARAALLTDVIEVVLAHELTHALHDQHSDLVRITRGLADQDALMAASATWEGLATWVSEQAAGSIGDTDAWLWLAGLQGWSPRGLEEKTAYPVWATYGRGRDAIAWHFTHGGYDEVWAVATAPPVSSSGVFRPESWQAPRPPLSVDYPGVLRGTDRVLTEGDWDVGISAVGEFELRGEAIAGDTEAALDAIMSHLASAWQLTGNRADRACSVRLLEFDGPEWPERYLDALRTQETADAAVLASTLGREVEVTYLPFDAVAGDVSILRSSRVTGLGGTGAERHAAWVVRGDTVLIVTAQAFRPGLRLGWAVDGVFSRLDAARAGDPAPPP